MEELDLLEVPRIKRKFDPNWRTDKNRIIARRFDREFFDGDRSNGYGGYYYDGRWINVSKRLEKRYNLNSSSSVLDIGCAKGFLLHDLQKVIPGIKVAGVDISEYALRRPMDGYARYLVKNNIAPQLAESLEEKAKEEIAGLMILASADCLPYKDESFDLVLSINTTHNLPKERFEKAISEMLRVSKDKKKMFIQLDSYANEKQKKAMYNWNLTGITFMSDEEWFEYLPKLGYEGDFYGTRLESDED